MGTVFKKTFTKPLPASAEVFVRNGQRLARWKDSKGKMRTAPLTVGKDGSERLLLESPYFIAKWRDGGGVVREQTTGCRDETAARGVLADLERRAELVKAKVLTAAEDRVARHQTTPIAEHFEAFDEHLRAKGDCELHRACVAQRLKRLAAECPFATLAELAREPLERWLAARTVEGLAAKSRNHYRNALVTFANWCVSTDRLIANPFSVVGKANEKADRRRQRRALNEPELVRLLDMARQRPLLDALTVRRGKRAGERYANVRDEVRDRLELLGRERALIYKTLVLTGLRKGELASLTVGQMFLDEAVPFLDLDPADEKNREGNAIVLRDDLAADLRQWLADKLQALQAEALRTGQPIPARLPADMPIFTVPAGLLRILDRDLVLAGIARRVKGVDGKVRIDKRDERGRTIDVHALRTTFGTLLSKGGVSPRTAQAAMRHSDIRLTMQVYTDPKLLDVHGALDALPALPLGGERQSMRQAAGAEADKDLRHSPLAPLLAPPAYNSGQSGTIPAKTAGQEEEGVEPGSVAATSSAAKAKDPLTSAVSGSSIWALRDSNPRPHGCDSTLGPFRKA